MDGTYLGPLLRVYELQSLEGTAGEARLPGLYPLATHGHYYYIRTGYCTLLKEGFPFTVQQPGAGQHVANTCLEPTLTNTCLGPTTTDLPVFGTGFSPLDDVGRIFWLS